IPWDEWTGQFIDDMNFVMAWTANADYDYWQNAEDPLQYTAKGRGWDHLPTKSNGLPYPLEREIIDTSGNPGRWTLRSGYYEAVGSVMWLGESFWKLTGAKKDEVTGAAWIQVSNPVDSVTRLEVLRKCFSSDAGFERELQD